MHGINSDVKFIFEYYFFHMQTSRAAPLTNGKRAVTIPGLRGANVFPCVHWLDNLTGAYQL
jgi:hypothetical protein